MSEVHRDNLKRLGDELEDYATANGRAGSNPALCTAAANGMFLAHSTGARTFADICHTRTILSSRELSRQNSEAPRTDSTEVRLGTEGDVFLYAGPFRYPGMDCGVLFRGELESDGENHVVAVPFDTGALINHLLPDDTDEDRREFIKQHELPTPQYRGYFGKFLEVLFAEPSHYLSKTGPIAPLPYAFNPGGDERRWTFEIRVSDSVNLEQHIEAIFVARNSVRGGALGPGAASVEEFLAWCKKEGIFIDCFDSAEENHATDFQILQQRCVAYIRRKLGV